jgi:hypothetical protein
MNCSMLDLIILVLGEMFKINGAARPSKDTCRIVIRTQISEPFQARIGTFCSKIIENIGDQTS